MPVAASFCADFLKADMQHVYRQVAGLREFGSVVLTRRRENAGAFPFPEDRIAVIPKPAFRFAVRIWQRSIKGGPLQLTAREVRDCLAALERFKADVLHVYFGHIGIFALPLLRAWRGARIVSFHGADAGVDAGSAAHRRALAEVFALSDLIQGRSEALLADLAALGCPQESSGSSARRCRSTNCRFPSDRSRPPGAHGISPKPAASSKKGAAHHPARFRRNRQSAAERPAHHHAATVRCSPTCAPLPTSWESGRASPSRGSSAKAALRSLFAESHAFFHPSQTGADGNREGVPNAMLEAMAMGAQRSPPDTAASPRRSRTARAGCW
ncbi:MAG: glycosyltransferase [Verrucomicrobiales bacterium]